MAPASNEEQFKFLISCIRYSNNGKVDFGEVAKECKIVTKGAAAKRYERMMRSHGIAPNAASIKPAPNTTSTSAPPSTSGARNKSNANKKRKFSGEEENVDDEEDGANQGSSSNKARMKKEVNVKGEMGQGQGHGLGHGLAHVKEEAWREDSPSAQLREGLGLGAGLCDVNRELVGYYSDGSGVDGVDYVDVEGYAGAGGLNAGGMNAGGMNAGGMASGGMASGGMASYNQQQTGYPFDNSGYGGTMSSQRMTTNGNGNGNGNNMSSHGSHNMIRPRTQASNPGGMGMAAHHYASMRQGYDTQGGSESPLLVE